MIVKTRSLYQQVIEVTTSYLGPAAARFIDRQIQNHLDKAPETINQKDLEKLIDWSSIAVALLTDDKKVIQDFTRSLQKLSEPEGSA